MAPYIKKYDFYFEGKIDICIDLSLGNHFLELPGNKLVGVASDGLKIWDLKSGNLEVTLEDHNNFIINVYYFLDKELKIVSASEDGIIKIWNPSGGCTTTLSRGNQKLTSMILCENIFIVTGSDEGMVTIWNAQTGEFEKEFTDSPHEILFIKNMNNGRIAIHSMDLKLRIYDSFKCVLCIQAYYPEDDGNELFYVFPNYIINCYEDINLAVIDPLTGHIKLKIEGDCSICDLIMVDNKIVTKSNGNRIKVWDLVSGKLECEYPHKSEIRGMCLLPDNSIVLKNKSEIIILGVRKIPIEVNFGHQMFVLSDNRLLLASDKNIIIMR